METMTRKWFLLTMVPLPVALMAAPAAVRSRGNGNAGSTNGGTIATSRSSIPSPLPLRPAIGRRTIGRLLDSLGEGCR